MMHVLKPGTAEANHDGTWWLESDGSATVKCPLCGKKDSLRDTHISDQGETCAPGGLPSDCSREGCHFHEYIVLAGWEKPEDELVCEDASGMIMGIVLTNMVEQNALNILSRTGRSIEEIQKVILELDLSNVARRFGKSARAGSVAPLPSETRTQKYVDPFYNKDTLTPREPR